MKPPTIESIHPRMAASFALISITVGIELGLYVSAGWGFFPGETATILLLVATPMVTVYAGSLLIWCPVVHWTRAKIRGTVYVSIGLLASVAGAAGLAALWQPLYFAWIVGMIAEFVFGGIALILLAWIWWTPPHQRPGATAVPCPECGYDMRGQRDCTCPECGNSFTLAEISARDQIP